MITFVYCVIGVILSVWSFLAVSSSRRVDGVDLSIAIIFFGLLWPIGLLLLACVCMIEKLNKKHKGA